jgi:hypothetical protein
MKQLTVQEAFASDIFALTEMELLLKRKDNPYTVEFWQCNIKDWDGLQLWMTNVKPPQDSDGAILMFNESFITINVLKDGTNAAASLAYAHSILADIERLFGGACDQLPC